RRNRRRSPPADRPRLSRNHPDGDSPGTFRSGSDARPFGEGPVPPVASPPPPRPDSGKMAAAAVEPGSRRGGARFSGGDRRLPAALSAFPSVPAERVGRRAVPDETPLPGRQLSGENRADPRGDERAGLFDRRDRRLSRRDRGGLRTHA